MSDREASGETVETTAAERPAELSEDAPRPIKVTRAGWRVGQAPLEPPRSTPGGALLVATSVGLAAALVAVLLGLRVIAIATLPHIVTPNDPSNFLEATDGLPIPRLLDWNQSFIEFLLLLRSLSGPLLWLAYALLFGPLWLLAIHILNPTFRLFHPTPKPPARPTPAPRPAPTTPPPSASDSAIPPPLYAASATTHTDGSEPPSSEAEADPSPLAAIPSVLHADVEVRRLGKPLVLLLAVCLPLAFVWIALDWFGAAFGSEGISGVFRALWLVVVGVALWVGFAREGIAGDFNAAEWGTLDDRLPGLLLRGALFGLGVFALTQWAAPRPLEPLLVRFQALGTFNRASFSLFLRTYLLSVVGVGFACGTWLYLLRRARLNVAGRAALLLLPLIGLAVALLPQRAFAPNRLAARYDLTPPVLAAIPRTWNPRIPTSGVPDGPRAAQELAQRAGIVPQKDTNRPERSLLVFHARGLVNIRQATVSEDGLPLDAVSAARVRAFLQKRDYQSALSWEAIKYLFDVAVSDFDPTSALATCLPDQEHAPHLARIDMPMRSLFFLSSNSPQNRALLDQLADDRRFAYPDRESLRMMGDLYNRIGALQQAEAWYRRAEMPHSFFTMIHTYPVFHTASVSGSLRLNGRPLSGVRVGLLPKRLNGLPRDLQGMVLNVDREVMGDPQASTPFAPFHPRPFAFRWICAGTTTDAQGAFTLPDLIEGEYYLIIALPPDIQLTPPFDSALQVRNAPNPIVLNAGQPAANLGTLDLTYRR